MKDRIIKLTDLSGNKYSADYDLFRGRPADEHFGDWIITAVNGTTRLFLGSNKAGVLEAVLRDDYDGLLCSVDMAEVCKLIRY